MSDFENNKDNSEIIDETVDTQERGKMGLIQRIKNCAVMQYINNNDWLQWILTIVAAFLIAFLLRTFVLTIATVSGNSMLPTLRNGDILYVNKFMYTPEKGDVVIVDMESRKGKDANERYHVKRVIATEGDTIYISNKGEVYVNGKVIDEPYIDDVTSLNGSRMRKYTFDNPLKIGKGEVFVMGDNRGPGESYDNRISETYTVDMIEGHALFRLWPLGDFGSFEKD